MKLGCGEQVAAPESHRAGTDDPVEIELTETRLQKRPLQPIDVLDAGGSGRREVADVGVIRPLAELEYLDQLGNQQVDVEVALAVAMARQIEGYALERRREVGAVIEVEAAQKELVGLAAAGVLGGDQPGNALQNLPRSQVRHPLDFGLSDTPHRRRIDDAEQTFRATDDDNLFDRAVARLLLIFVRRRRCGAEDQRHHTAAETVHPTSPEPLPKPTARTIERRASAGTIARQGSSFPVHVSSSATEVPTVRASAPRRSAPVGAS